MADENDPLLQAIDNYEIAWLNATKTFAENIQRFVKSIKYHACFMSMANEQKNDELFKAEYRAVLDILEFTQTVINDRINSCNEQLKN